MAKTFSFRVTGRPAPQGSKTPLRGGRFRESSKYLKPWRQAVAKAAKAFTPKDWHATMAMSVSIVFIIARPKGDYRASGQLKFDAPVLCTKRTGDIDKLCRAVLDSLSGSVSGGAGVFDDDSQVIHLQAERRYAVNPEEPGAIISITSINVRTN